MELQVGKYYQMTRITGKVIRFKLVMFDPIKKRLETLDMNAGGMFNMDNLSDDELSTLKEISNDAN